MFDDDLPDLTFIELGALEDWTTEGVRCVIRPGYASLNGYVRLPEKLRDWWANYGEANEVMSAHFGLTYGPDEDGWIGYDTAHYCDYWATDDLIGRIPDEALHLANTFSRINAQMPGARRWTLSMLRGETEVLAAQVAALQGDVEGGKLPGWLTGAGDDDA